MPLTEVTVRAAKAQEKAYKLPDGRGLHLLVTPRGSKLWRLRYRWQGRETMLSLGAYPEISLKDARLRRDEARMMVAKGIDPAQERRQERVGREHLFKDVAREWLGKQGFADSSLTRMQYLIDKLNERIGSRAVAELTTDDARAVLLRIEAKGHAPDAHRARQIIRRVMRYSRAMGYGGGVITEDLQGALKRFKYVAHPGLTDPAEVGELLKRMDAYQGTISVAVALWLQARLWVRPKELRGMEWSELDLDLAIWRIPPQRAKLRRWHLVPLCPQVVEKLRWMRQLTGDGWLVLPNRDDGGMIASDSMNSALASMGYADRQTAHGFRTTASTLLHELGAPHEAIEVQMAHKKKGAHGVYDQAAHLPVRKAFMCAYGDYLDALKAGSPASAAAVFRATFQASMSLALQATVL